MADSASSSVSGRDSVSPRPMVRMTSATWSDHVLPTSVTTGVPACTSVLALNEIFDYGRPASVRLAALVDRGGRQLPICAQYCGAKVEVPEGQRLRLKRTDTGRLRLELEDAA